MAVVRDEGADSVRSLRLTSPRREPFKRLQPRNPLSGSTGCNRQSELRARLEAGFDRGLTPGAATERLPLRNAGGLNRRRSESFADVDVDAEDYPDRIPHSGQ